MRVGTDISDWIITPIENYLSGRSQDAVFDLYYQGLTFQNIARDHREDELAMAIRPYVMEYILYPENRIYRLGKAYMVTSLISKSMEICDNWARMTGRINWIEFIDKHASLIHQELCYENKCMVILSHLSRKGYQEDWDSLYVVVKKKLKDKEVRKDSERLELYAFFMAVIMIERSKMTIPDKNKQLILLERKWSVISYLYSLVLNRIVGTKYTKYVQLAAQTRSNKSRTEYGHLFLKVADWIILRSPQYFASENKFKFQLEQLRKIVEGEYINHELDILAETLFPEIFGKKTIKPQTSEELSSEAIVLIDSIDASLHPEVHKKLYESYLKAHPGEGKPVIQINHNVTMTGDHAQYIENSDKEDKE